MTCSLLFHVRLGCSVGACAFVYIISELELVACQRHARHCQVEGLMGACQGYVERYRCCLRFDLHSNIAPDSTLHTSDLTAQIQFI